MSGDQAKQIQRTLNAFRKKYLRGYPPLRVDGQKGHATNVAIQVAKYYTGGGAHLKSNSAHWSHVTAQRVKHPRTSSFFPHGGRMLRVGMKRRLKQRALYRANKAKSYSKSGVSRFDGKPVASWMVPYLRYARAHGWHGHVNSGWRDPRYSESLCRQRCGRPSCPGTCAGRASNHSGSSKPHGAVDVSDYYRFGIIMRSAPYFPHLYNALGSRDPVHYSASGR